MAENKNNDSSSDAMLFMLVTALIFGGIAKNIDHLEAWFWDHIGFIIMLGIGLIYGIYKFMQWRFKMKHPEVYERELAIKQMDRESRNNQNF